jgi:hypothetical protein
MYKDILIEDIITWQVSNANAKYLLMILASYTNADGACYPSIPSLCARSELSRSTTIRTLNWCIEHKYLLRVSGRTGVASSYQFTCLMENIMDDDQGSVTQTPQVISNIIKINDNNNKTTWGVTQTLPTFDAFWSAYPRKIAKGHARKAFEKACRLADPSEIIAAVGKFAYATQDTDKQYIPHPTTWLNGERWEDDMDDVSPRAKTNADYLDEILSNMDANNIAIGKD